MQLTIKVDIDGVMRDMITPMVKIYNDDFGTSLTSDDITDYDLSISFPLLKEKGIDPHTYFFVTHAEETIQNAPIFDGAKDAMDYLMSKGCDIVIVTYQPSFDAKVMTLKWLERHEIPFHRICFVNTNDKTKIPCNIMIDDCMTFLDAERGAVRICIDRPYNQDGRYDLRFDSLDEIKLLIK